MISGWLTFSTYFEGLGKTPYLKILQISHAQWLFRNATLYNANTGYLRAQERRAVLQEADMLSQLNPHELPERSRYLLEINFYTLP